MSVVLITLFAGSFIFLFTYFFVVNSLYSKENGLLISIRNTFLYEGSSLIVTKGFLFTSLLCSLGASIYFTTDYFSLPYGSLSLVIVIVSGILVFCLSMLPLVSFRFLKEHLYLDIGALISLFAIFALEAYYCFDVYKLYDYNNVSALIGMIFALILLVGVFTFVFNPRLFDLKSDLIDGVEVRKKFIPLALLEWCMLLFASLTSVPLILLSFAF